MKTGAIGLPASPAQRGVGRLGGKRSGAGLFALIRPLGVPVLVLLVWEAVAKLHVLSPQLFPPVEKIAASFFDTLTGTTHVAEWHSGKWWYHAWGSTSRVLIGFALGGATGVILGTVMGMFRLLHDAVDPSIQLVRPIPVLAWIPLAVAWFGIGDRPAIFLVALGTMFPAYLSTIHGIRYVDPILVRAAKMLGYTSSWDIFRRVILFSALPSIFTGLRIGMGVAWTCVVASEMLAVKSGLGYMLWDSYNFLRTDLIITGMISIGIMGFLTDRVLLIVQGRMLAWET